MNSLGNDESKYAQGIIKAAFKDHSDLIEFIIKDTTIVVNIQDTSMAIIEALKKGGKLLLCGNGGSAADSQHIATELVSKFFKDRKAFNAEALTVNTSSLTAIGNDCGFDKIFSRQVEAKIKPGDVLIGISTSGNSANVVEAIMIAKKMGAVTICMIGGDPQCALASISDYCISVPSLCTPRIQEAHILIGHIMCEMIENVLSS